MIEILLSVIAVLAAAICFLLYQIYRLKYRGKVSGIVPKVDFEEDLGTDERLASRLEELSERMDDVESQVNKNGKTLERLLRSMAG